MSMNPVTAINAAVLAQSEEPNSRRDPSTSRSVQATPHAGVQPNRETHAPPKAQDSSELPRDAVQVQRENGNQIVIKYLDRSGRMVIQVPSSQVLALQRAIEQALEEQAQSRTSAAKSNSRRNS